MNQYNQPVENMHISQWRRSLGAIRLSNHKPDLCPIHSHLKDSIKMLRALKNKKVGSDSTQNWESKPSDNTRRLNSSFFTKQPRNIYTNAAQALL